MRPLRGLVAKQLKSVKITHNLKIGLYIFFLHLLVKKTSRIATRCNEAVLDRTFMFKLHQLLYKKDYKPRKRDT